MVCISCSIFLRGLPTVPLLQEEQEKYLLSPVTKERNYYACIPDLKPSKISSRVAGRLTQRFEDATHVESFLLLPGTETGHIRWTSSLEIGIVSHKSLGVTFGMERWWKVRAF